MLEFLSTSFKLNAAIKFNRKKKPVFNLFEDTPVSSQQGWASISFVPKATIVQPAPTMAHQPVSLPVNRSPEVDALIAQDAVISLNISGGKDSIGMAIATVAFLDSIGHTGPRVLIHADLGVVEWKDSLPCCERLAQKLG